MNVGPREWDAWRSDPLTKRCLGVMKQHAEQRWGALADREARKNFAGLFASPERQAQYSALRGRLCVVSELIDALALGLDELIDTGTENETDRPEDV